MTNEYQRQQKIRQQVADAAYKKRLQEASGPSIDEQADKAIALENAKAARRPPKLTPAQKRLQQLEDDGAIPLANGGFLVGDTVYRPDGTVDHKLDQKDHSRTPEQMAKEENPFTAKGGIVQSDGTIWVPGKNHSVDVMSQSADGSWRLAHSYGAKDLYGMTLFDQTGKHAGEESADEKKAVNAYLGANDGIPPSRSGGQTGYKQEKGNSEGNVNGPDVLDLPRNQDRGVRQYNDPAGPPAELAADQTALAEAAQVPARPSSGNIAGPAKPRGAPVHQRAPDTVPTQPEGHMTYQYLADLHKYEPAGMTYGPFNPYGAGQQGSWTGSWSDDDNYVPGFKMGGHMAIRGPATLYDDATGQPIAKLGENRPEELYGHSDGSVGIMNHIPSGLRGFASGGTFEPPSADPETYPGEYNGSQLGDFGDFGDGGIGLPAPEWPRQPTDPVDRYLASRPPVTNIQDYANRARQYANSLGLSPNWEVALPPTGIGPTPGAGGYFMPGKSTNGGWGNHILLDNKTAAAGDPQGAEGLVHEAIHALESKFSPQDQLQLQALEKAYPVPPAFNTWHPGGVTGYFDAHARAGIPIPPPIIDFINKHLPSGPPPPQITPFAGGGTIKGFATGGTITASGTPIVNPPPTATTGGNPPMANPPTATSGGNPPVAGQPNQSYSGLSFPGTTIGGYNLQGLNAGTIPSSPFSYNGTGNIPQGQEPNQLESQSYGYLSGLQNYKNTFNTSLQNTLAGINTARQNALTQMAGAEANEPARLAAQHLREVYDPHYGMAGIAKPQEIAPPVGMFGTPSEPATTSGVGLRWQLQTPQEAYNRINQPLSEYESLIGKTASGVFSQITDAQDKARLIIAALKAENPSKPNPYGSGLVPSNQYPTGGNLTPQQQANDDAALLRAEMGLETGQTGTITLPSGLSVTYSGRKPKAGEEGGSGGMVARKPSGPLQPQLGPNGPTGKLVPITGTAQGNLPPGTHVGPNQFSYGTTQAQIAAWYAAHPGQT